MGFNRIEEGLNRVFNAGQGLMGLIGFSRAFNEL